MIQIIVLALILIAWYMGFRMAKSKGDIVIGYREQEIESLKKQVDWLDKLTDNLFNEEDMRMSFMKGITTCSWQGATYPLPDWDKEFDKWLDHKYTKQEPQTEQP